MASRALNEAIRHLAWVVEDVTIESLADIAFTSEDQARYGEILMGKEYDPEDYYFHSLAWGLLRTRARERQSLQNALADCIGGLLAGDEESVSAIRGRLRSLLRTPYWASPSRLSDDQADALRAALSALGPDPSEVTDG